MLNPAPLVQHSDGLPRNGARPRVLCKHLNRRLLPEAPRQPHPARLRPRAHLGAPPGRRLSPGLTLVRGISRLAQHRRPVWPSQLGLLRNSASNGGSRRRSAGSSRKPMPRARPRLRQPLAAAQRHPPSRGQRWARQSRWMTWMTRRRPRRSPLSQNGVCQRSPGRDAVCSEGLAPHLAKPAKRQVRRASESCSRKGGGR